VPFALRLIAFSSLLICLSVGLSSYLVYRSSRAELTETLGRELLAVARSSAALIDADLVDLIHRDADGNIALLEEFQLLREQLDRVRTANGLPDRGSPIYIMRPAPDFDRSGLLEFVAMPDRDEGGRYFIGNLYPAEPHNRRAQAGVASASPLYEDGEGVWISAAAPLYDSAGRLVGQIQVDREVGYFLEAARRDALRILKGALLSIAAGALLSMVFARGLVRPIERIAAGLGRLGEGELDHRVEIRRNDEIGDLARGVNAMAANLQAAHKAKETASRALVISDRLAAVGQLAAGVAHEINNPLTYVRTNLALMLDGWADLAKRLRSAEPQGPQAPLVLEGEEMLNESLEGVDRALRIVRDIKGLAHDGGRDRGERALVDLNELLDGVLRVASAQLGAGIEVERRYGHVPLVLAAGQELKQVFINLVLNANQAMASGGRITVSTETRGDAVVVHVEDDGPGIEDDVLDRIFDPFFTTKPVGEGTGLGLSISYEIVRRHDGEIRVESEPGHGSRFSVILPGGT
jgi:signal transduction histidine kinase